LARGAGLLLVVGSSLEVFPVAGLPHETLAAGGELAIVNLEPTPFDGRAAVKIDGRASPALGEVAYSGSGPLDRPLFENFATGEAERALDLVRNAVALKEHYGRYRRMLVCLFLDDLHVNSD
jgi:hypothetical protein